MTLEEGDMVGVKIRPDGSIDKSHGLVVLGNETEVPTQNTSAVQTLEQRLAIINPELTNEQRLENWVTAQEVGGKLNPLDTGVSGFKTPLLIKDNDDLILKRYDKGANRLAYLDESAEVATAEQELPSHFFPKSRFIEVHRSEDEDKKYYVLQDKMKGVHVKTAASEAQEFVFNMSEEEQIPYQTDPEKWMKLRSDMLKRKLTDEQWKQAREEALELHSALSIFEQKQKMTDVDFFITPGGNIKLIDFQVESLDTYVPMEGGFPEGAEEIRMLFDIDSSSGDLDYDNNTRLNQLKDDLKNL